MYSTIFNKVVFPVLELALRRHISSTTAKYASLQYQPYELLKTRQEAKMRRLLRHAFDNVPFYERGGVMKANSVFGNRFNPMLDELNEVLAA